MRENGRGCGRGRRGCGCAPREWQPPFWRRDRGHVNDCGRDRGHAHENDSDDRGCVHGRCDRGHVSDSDGRGCVHSPRVRFHYRDHAPRENAPHANDLIINYKTSNFDMILN